MANEPAKRIYFQALPGINEQVALQMTRDGHQVKAMQMHE